MNKEAQENLEYRLDEARRIKQEEEAGFITSFEANRRLQELAKPLN